MPLIQLKEVSKSYRHLPILNDINLSIDEGDIVGIIGKSGSGKTTLLNIMSGVDKPSTGGVLYHTPMGVVDLHQNLHQIKKHIGLTPQHNSFYPKLTIKENLLHFGSMYDISHETLVGNIKNLLNTTRLFDSRNMLAEHLSGGMQKRLDLACSLAHKPEILLLDEPTADLDPVLTQEILFFLKEVNKQGVSIVIVSHDLDSLETICNKIAILHQGVIHSCGSVDELRKPFLSKELTIDLKPSQDKDKIIETLKTMPVTKIIDQGFNLSVYPKDIASTLKQILAFTEKNDLNFNKVELRKLSLHEVFEKIAKER